MSFVVGFAVIAAVFAALGLIGLAFPQFQYAKEDEG